jgi:hypothetical protein
LDTDLVGFIFTSLLKVHVPMLVALLVPQMLMAASQSMVILIFIPPNIILALDITSVSA